METEVCRRSSRKRYSPFSRESLATMSTVSRNDPCPCGSQKKYKACCLSADERADAERRAEQQGKLNIVPKLIKEGIGLHQSGQIEAARQCYQKVLHLNPADPDALHLLGVISRDSGFCEEAIRLIGRAIEILPGEASFHNNMGIAYRRLGQDECALGCYEKALAINPDHAEALNNLGNVCSSLRRFPEAIQCFQRTISLTPSFAEAHFNLGHVFQALERNEEALNCYRQALTIRPNYVDALSNCGMTLHLLERDEEALACLEQAITQQPDFQPAYMNIGCISLNNGLAREALPFLQHANQLSPEDPDTLNVLSHAEKDLGLLENAMAHARQAFSLSPESSAGLEAALRLALIKYLHGDRAGAADLLSQTNAIKHIGARSVRAYWTYLDRLIVWGTHLEAQVDAPTDELYAIGDSHVLSLHGLPLVIHGRHYCGKALWIEGCKQWHLGKGEDNTYKFQFESYLLSIPRGSAVLVSVGEIDCRPDEGILNAWNKQQTESILELIANTVRRFVSYTARWRDTLGLEITLSGVPATNVHLNQEDQASTQRFLTLLQDFNQALSLQAREAGMGFLDLYALTNTGNAKADGRWHVDNVHLQPGAYVQAFRENLTVARVGSNPYVSLP